MDTWYLNSTTWSFLFIKWVTKFKTPTSSSTLPHHFHTSFVFQHPLQVPSHAMEWNISKWYRMNADLMQIEKIKVKQWVGNVTGKSNTSLVTRLKEFDLNHIKRYTLYSFYFFFFFVYRLKKCHPKYMLIFLFGFNDLAL